MSNIFKDEKCEQCGISGEEEQLTYDENGSLICTECFFVNSIDGTYDEA